MAGSTTKINIQDLIHCRVMERKGEKSKEVPTDPWNIPQTLDFPFMKEILSYLYFGVPGVCSRGLLEFSSENMFHTLVHLTSFCGSLDPINHGSEKWIEMAVLKR